MTQIPKIELELQFNIANAIFNVGLVTGQSMKRVINFRQGRLCAL
jgi:hypothetical protein